MDGVPTGVRFGNVMDSVCSGADRFDAQVLVTFDMLARLERVEVAREVLLVP